MHLQHVVRPAVAADWLTRTEDPGGYIFGDISSILAAPQVYAGSQIGWVRPDRTGGPVPAFRAAQNLVWRFSIRVHGDLYGYR